MNEQIVAESCRQLQKMPSIHYHFIKHEIVVADDASRYT